MITERRVIQVGGLPVEVVRKPIKNLHLAVYPPEGQVRIAVPLHLDNEAVRLAVVDKLGWIRRKQKHFTDQARQSAREMVTGESHYFEGRRYRLNVVRHNGPNRIVLRGHTGMDLFVRPNADAERCRAVLTAWYRAQLKGRLPALIAKWEPIIGVTVADGRVKRMKTRWGTCNIAARRIWLNLELIKKPPMCLEYVLVHEMVHLLERHHNERFQGFMDTFMPAWRQHRQTLNAAPLAHETWAY